MVEFGYLANKGAVSNGLDGLTVAEGRKEGAKPQTQEFFEGRKENLSLVPRHYLRHETIFTNLIDCFYVFNSKKNSLKEATCSLNYSAYDVFL